MFWYFFAINYEILIHDGLISASACSIFEIQAQVKELFLPPFKLFRERSRRLRQSECRGRSRETNAAVIRVICVTNW